MVTSFGPLLQLMKNGTIPPAEANEMMYYLQLNARGQHFSVAKVEPNETPLPTPSDD